MNVELDVKRHRSLFNPAEWGNRRVDVIGCGAIGSRLAMELAKLGVTNLHLWDDDIVESHNIPNQFFYNTDIGKKKVDAIAEHIVQATGNRPSIHDERVDGSQELGEVIFVLTDSMKSRKEIWERAIINNYTVEVMIEARMGLSGGKVFTINPNDLDHIDIWKGSSHFDDSRAQPSACGGKVSVGPTAAIIACSMAWQFINWFRYDKDLKDPNLPDEKKRGWPSKRLYLDFNPFSVTTDVHFESKDEE